MRFHIEATMACAAILLYDDGYNTVARRANAMIPRRGSRVGEYMWEKELERLNRYNDRPWEQESKESRGNPLLTFLFLCLGIFAGLLLLSLF